MTALVPTPGRPVRSGGGRGAAVEGPEPGRGIDAAVGVTLFLVLLMLLPARFVVPGLSSLGSPALLIGLGLGAWWALGRLTPTIGGERGPQPVRTVALVWIVVILISVVMTYDRMVTPAEVAAGDRAFASMLGALGVTLLAADGLADHDRLRAVLRVLCPLGALVGVLGVLQYVGIDVVPQLRLPGLAVNGDLATVLAREGLRRPASTALHPIEFGVVMAMVMPLAVYLIHRETSRLRRQLAALYVLAMAGGAFVSVSRAAVVGLGVMLLVLVTGMGWRQRLNVATAAAVIGTMILFALPGAVRTLSGLFRRVGTDTSISARTDDYSYVLDVVAQRPMFGLGFGTYTPSEYRILDNQYLLLVAETGFLGLATMVGVIAVALLMCVRIRRRPGSQVLGVCLMASIAAATVSMGTFDGFAFRMFTGVFMTVLGLIGAAWRLTETPEADDGAAGAGARDLHRARRS